MGDRDDVVLHHRRAGGDAAERALLVGRTADRWGRKPLFLVGFGILPLRAALYTLSDDSAWLIGVQLLDGVGAGIFGALTPLVIADLIARHRPVQHGPGRGCDAARDRRVIERAGRRHYRRPFRLQPGVPHLGVVAAAAFAVFLLFMPETAPARRAAAPGDLISKSG